MLRNEDRIPGFTQVCQNLCCLPLQCGYEFCSHNSDTILSLLHFQAFPAGNLRNLNKEPPLYHSVEVNKNVLSGIKSSVGGFDSHALPPFDFKVLLIYLLRPLRRFLWSARGTNSFKTRRKGYKEKNLLRNETWCPSCLYGYSINVYTTIILDLYNVVYFKQLLTDLCHSIKPFNLE